MDSKPTIFFDLDGTVYPLYTQKDWLPRITTLADASVYGVEATMVDAAELLEVLCELVEAGYRIGVISWLAKWTSESGENLPLDPAYAKACRTEKRVWARKFLPMATEIHVVKYGTPKHSTIRNNPHAILVDDVAEVRAAWCHGLTIDPTKNLIKRLRSLL